jgi:hypothetical protein
LRTSVITEIIGEIRPKQTDDSIPALHNAIEAERLVRMHQLAEIFAEIFEALPGGSEHANSTVEKAA